MRRRTATGGGVPDRLARFVVDDWAPGDPWPAFQAGRDARQAWVDAGNVWPGGEDARSGQHSDVISELPDEPFVPVIGRNV